MPESSLPAFLADNHIIAVSPMTNPSGNCGNTGKEICLMRHELAPLGDNPSWIYRSFLRLRSLTRPKRLESRSLALAFRYHVREHRKRPLGLQPEADVFRVSARDMIAFQDILGRTSRILGGNN